MVFGVKTWPVAQCNFDQWALFGCLLVNLLSLNTASADRQLCNYTSYVLEAATAVRAMQASKGCKNVPANVKLHHAPASSTELFVMQGL